MATKRGLFDRLTRVPEEIRAENLRRWACSLRDITPIEQVEPRRRCRCAGVVQNIRIDPRQGRGSIEATIIDGTSELVVKWLGRQALSGVTLGMGLIVEGAVGVGDGGEPVILNPDYQLVPGPEHG